MRMRTQQAGFTIVELMITVTVIGALAALAIPFYQQYTTRAKVAEGLALAHGAKLAVADYYSANGGFPDDNAQAGLDAAANLGGRIVESVTVEAGGVIVVVFLDKALARQQLVFTPEATGGNLVWTCTTTLPPALRPTQECQ